LDCNMNGIPDECEDDCNGNGIPDDCDIASQTSQDCNANGIPDECDITSGTSQDCNGNGIPDECDIASQTSQDCNGNNVPDECDITSGTSQDCNANGIPDECDLANQTSQDCNANGIPDECDIASQTSQDCNTNGVPDECDLASQTSEDCNGNNIPDECDLTSGTSQDCNGNNIPDECDITSRTSQDCNSNNIPDECDISSHTSADENANGVPDECEGANLEAVKTAHMEPAQAGYVITYTITVMNLGPAQAPGVTVVDPLPAGLEYIESMSSQGTTGLTSGTVTANIGLLDAGSSASVTIRAMVTQPGTYVNVASAESNITDPVTANNTSTVITDVCPGYSPVVQDEFTSATADGGWTPFAMSVPNFADQTWDGLSEALVGRITADPVRFRTAGYVTVPGLWMPYDAVGSDHYVRGKFYVFASPHASDWMTTGAMPNVRMRLSHRFAQNAMLEVFNHRNVDPEASIVAQDFRPSTDPARPSLYRVDFDPVDTPYLRDSGTTEGIWTAFEAYSIDPQDEGIVGLAEVIVGVYPKTLLPDSVAPVKVYAPGEGDAGDLKVVEPTDLQVHNYFDIAYYGLGEMPEDDTNPATPAPTYYEGPEGVTLSSVGVPANRLAVITREFNPGSLTERMRVEPNKIYKIRFHVTSSRPSWLQSQFRGRARTSRFMWSQKIEIGGAFNAGVQSNADAQQALPGIGCLNPDHEPGESNGGWYTLIVHSPLSNDIRPEYDASDPIEMRMPHLSAEPGPGVNATSLRDLRVGFDLMDTLSGSMLRGWEEGEFTLDRIEIRVYDEFEDGPCNLGV